MPRLLPCLLALVVAHSATRGTAAQEPPDRPRSPDAEATRPGPIEGGRLLANGWKVTPVGESIALSDMPLNVLLTPDGRYAIVATSGYNNHELTVVDLEARKRVATEAVRQSWFGLAADADRSRIWWAGGGSNVLHGFTRDGETLRRVGDPEPGAEASSKDHFLGGLALSPDGQTLYSLDVDTGTIAAIDPATGAIRAQGSIGGRPYDVAIARNGSRLYVSDWAGRSVLAIDPASLRVVDRIGVGEHPNQIVAHPDDDRLFVACASSNSVSVIDSGRGVVIETIATGLFPRAPEGSTPDAVVVAPDGETLYVANADNNCVAVVDIEEPGESAVEGFIPTGWYPTALAITLDGKDLLIGVGQGKTAPNPPEGGARERLGRLLTQERVDIEAELKRAYLKYPYVGTLLEGSLTIVPVPDEETLARYTETVYENCPYSDDLLSAAPGPEGNPIPRAVGEPSPIKHVIYIIKENRTYDQVLGDIERGEGDPSLVMFGREVTPNHHKLAEEYVQLDNLYCNGHVSRDGHPWSTMAYNTDWIARDWMLTYSRREGIDDDDEGNLATAPSGYLWDACARAGLSYRSYGEYAGRVSTPEGAVFFEGRVPGLVGHVCPEYGIPIAPGAVVRDTDKAETFLAEFRRFEAEDNLPRFIVMSLGEDHTSGTRPGAFTPQACVASNDLALGRIVEAVSKSKYWPETAIFVIEDDAQNGPDHVDSHRTVGLVASPYTRHGRLDSTQYQTVSMIRTMELILGLSPLSQFDAAATPMFAAFDAEPDTTPYEHEPARINLDAMNTRLSYGADRSMKMDFSEYDRVDDFELNEILWRAIKGPDAPLPPAVRRAIAYRPADRTDH